jgi:hypothetical protein
MTTPRNRVRGRANPAEQLTAARELRDGELDAVSGGFFAFYATAAAIDGVAKALATMAQKQ